MNRHCPDEALLTAKECADRTGLSIRALRLYEKHGLISPRRTSKRWRLYGNDDIARLNEILALKSIGLSLRSISGLLCDQPTDLAQTLILQRDALMDTKHRAERGLTVVEALQDKMRLGTPATIDDLMTLMRETNMAEPSRDNVAWRRYEQMRPRTEIAVDPALYDDYAGAYETDDGTFSIVSHRDGRIFYRIVGGADNEIFPETEAKFFMKVLPVQITFERDESQKVKYLKHHQSGFVDQALRADLKQALQIEKEDQHRINEQKPIPGGATLLCRVIEELSKREPDLSKMAPAVAELLEEQKGSIQVQLEEAGKLKQLSFKGVSQNGSDVYDAVFENSKIEWNFALTHRGLMSYLYFRPIL
ncbi:MerR family transcriptional regulator [Pseudovibrio japonicus]|uniref:MerR family transcriptional regulator n=1 Tax=Pseudovibrio japonicus TaxID=366534 RepID=A0ABQ3EJ34_9HYPH|nr:MerR family transcriptional regulator [Pseudovibrio japonicus]GHB42339.1 MerR family transcriptional regulator [Pseudovibrio japonicus]